MLHPLVTSSFNLKNKESSHVDQMAKELEGSKGERNG
jgi:hypothetical protein